MKEPAKGFLVSLVLVVGCCALLSDSQPPAPAPMKPSAQEQQPAKKGNRDRDVSNPGLPPHDARANQAAGNKESQQSENGSAPDWWGRVIALLTLIAIGVQCAVYVWQARIMKATIEAPRRPRFIVREAIPIVFCENTVEVSITVANTGDSPGTIVAGRSKFEASDYRALRPFYAASDFNEFGSISLRPGEHTRINWNIPLTDAMNMDLALWEEHNKASGPRYHFLRGFIVYEGANGLRRRMSFCRRFNPTNQRFERTDDPDYEYE